MLVPSFLNEDSHWPQSILGEPFSSYIIDYVVISTLFAIPKCSGRKIGLLALGAVNVNKEEEGQEEFNNGSQGQTCTTTSTRNFSTLTGKNRTTR